MGGLGVLNSYRGILYRSELGIVNSVCLDSAARYERDCCNSPTDQRLEKRADGYPAQLTLGQ
jgi:hypothetical protein